MKESEVDQWILGLFDFEKSKSLRQKLKAYTLDRILFVLEELGHPERDLKFIHIAGTKGKGSVAEYLTYLFKQSLQIDAGLFTSPHLTSVCERIRVGAYKIPENDFKAYTKQIYKISTEKLDSELTWFETLFLTALLFFKKRNIQWVIIETGLGGRLDASNIINPILSILTKIDYDHTEILGESLAEIAYEEACICKGTDTFALKQSPEVNTVFERVAHQRGSKLHWAQPESDKNSKAPQALLENATIATHAFQFLFPEAPTLSIHDLIQIPIPGRIQSLKIGERDWLFDVAHNQVSMELLAHVLHSKFPGPKRLGFAMAIGREPYELFAPLLKHFDEIAFFDLPGSRPGIEASDLAKQAKVMASKKTKIHEPQLEDWINAPFDGLSVVTGSFYLVGEIFNLCHYEPFPDKEF